MAIQHPPRYPGRPPVLIGSEIFRLSSFGERHPLAIPRVSTALDLIRALGALDPAQYRESPLASPAELARFHTPDYIQALQDGERDPASLDLERRQRHRLGFDGNPLHRHLYSRPATGCGGTLLAASLLVSGAAHTVYNMGGGTHHGRPDRASGFCYLNDIVLGVLAMLDAGAARIAYVDLDAHHGDGVEDALAHDPRLLPISIHEEKRWPYTGAAEARGGGRAHNFPVPAGFGDRDFDALIERRIVPLVAEFEPEILVVQGGADALAEDPLSRLALSNRALWRAVAVLRPLAPRFLLTGGGGYNPWSVARCWAGMWLTLNQIAIPERLPPAAEAVLRGLSWQRSPGRNPPPHWFTTLGDPPRETDRPARPLEPRPLSPGP